MDMTTIAFLTLFIVPVSSSEAPTVYSFPILSDLCEDMGHKMAELSTNEDQKAFYVCRDTSILMEQDDTPAEFKQET